MWSFWCWYTFIAFFVQYFYRLFGKGSYFKRTEWIVGIICSKFSAEVNVRVVYQKRSERLNLLAHVWSYLQQKPVEAAEHTWALYQATPATQSLTPQLIFRALLWKQGAHSPVWLVILLIKSHKQSRLCSLLNVK